MLRLILASRSPRRAAMLREAGFDPQILESPFCDPDQPPADAEPAALVQELAHRKALALGPRPGALVLAADTVCATPAGELLGKPRDQADARRMLELLQAGRQDVLTGVCLLAADGQTQVWSDRAHLRCGPVTAAQLAAALPEERWRGKAGGYNLGELLAAGWPIEVEGDPDTVVGLPLRRLLPQLQALGVARRG